MRVRLTQEWWCTVHHVALTHKQGVRPHHNIVMPDEVCTNIGKNGFYQISANCGCTQSRKSAWLLQLDSDPEQTSKSTINYFKKHKLRFSEQLSQSTDLNVIENLWVDLKLAVCKT